MHRLLKGLALCAALAGCSGDEQTSAALGDCQPPADLGGPVAIKAGQYRLGDSRFYPEEGPVVSVEVGAFDIDAHEVTNAQFAAFVEATGYITRAERGLPEADFDHLPDDFRRAGSAVFTPPKKTNPTALVDWWRFVEGAHWRAPDGPGSSITDKEAYPVVHIAYEDARAYAAWRGRRLPTEAEWEVAARSGLRGAPYAWGDTPPDDLDIPAANTWQGFFPISNEKTDGFVGLAPVGCYAANAYGLHDMIGNVWEWTSDAKTQRRDDPPAQDTADSGTIKGGSFLCAENYCQRYRPAARQFQERTFSASHIGFRTVGDLPASAGSPAAR